MSFRQLAFAAILLCGIAPWAQGVPITVSFQDGVDGYAGTKDTYVHEDATGTNQGANVRVYQDGDDDLGTAEANAQVVNGLIRFDNTFYWGFLDPPIVPPASGSRYGATQSKAIPDTPLVNIISAKLEVRTGTAAGDISASTFELHRMIATWDEASTWTSLTGGISYNDTEAAIAATASAAGGNVNVAGGLVTFDVTSTIALYLANPALSTRGWAIKSLSNSGAPPVAGQTDGWLFDSSETATVANRPKLTVTYEWVPEPGSIVLASIGGLGLAVAGVWRRMRRSPKG